MKNALRVMSFLGIYFALFSIIAKQKINIKVNLKVDSIHHNVSLSGQNGGNDEKENSKLIALKQEIAELTKNIADTKESFYQNKLDTWNLIITSVGLVLVLLSYWGFRNIFDRVNEVREENIQRISRIEAQISELRTEINSKSQEMRSDFKGYKKELKETYAKFEKDSMEQIQEGLDSQMQKAVKNIVKGVYGENINYLLEEVSKLTNKAAADDSQNESKIQNSNAFEDPITENIEEIIVEKEEKNAFDDGND